MRCINNTDKNVTVRKQKIRKNHVREKTDLFYNTGTDPASCSSFCPETLSI